MITLQQLMYFNELAQSGHLTHTAEKLYVTLPTLRNVISNLEKQLGVKLFTRVGRNLQLSEAGRLYHECVAQALTALETGQTRIDDYLHQNDGTLSFSTNNSIIWAGLIQDFQNSHADCSVRQIACSDGEQMRKMLLNMEIDFVIASTTDLSLDGLEWQVFRVEPVCLHLSKNHPLADRKQVYLRELEGEKFINLPRDHPFQRYCDSLLAQAGIQHKVVLESDCRTSIPLVENGAGISLITYISYRTSPSFLSGKTVCIPIADPIPPRAIALIWNPRRPLGQAALDFRAYLLDGTLDDQLGKEMGKS